MERRHFLTVAGIVSAGLLLPISKVWGAGDKDNEGTQVWLRLLEYARWSPSPHNVQPWKLKIISAKEAHLYYDPLRVPFLVDPGTSFTIVGLSMFIECMNISATAEGYIITAEHEQEPQLKNEEIGLKLFAKLHLAKTTEQPAIDRELIKTRRTSRLQYDGGVLAPGLVASLQNIVAAHGHILHYSSDPELIKYTINLNSEAILLEANDKPVLQEMSKWIRYSDKEAQEKKDGLSSTCMCTPGKLMHNFVFKHQRFNQKWKRDITHKMLNKGMGGTSNIAWITGSFENRTDWVKAGVMLQRLWLAMTAQNIYLHPMGTIVTVPSQHELFREHIKYDENNGTLWLLVRLGYSKQPPRSYRLTIEDLLV